MELVAIWYNPSKNEITKHYGDLPQLEHAIKSIVEAKAERPGPDSSWIELLDDDDMFTSMCAYYSVDELRSIANGDGDGFNIINDGGNFSMYLGPNKTDQAKMFIGECLI